MSTSIGADDGRHLFRYIGVLLSYITPHDLTVGMQSHFLAIFIILWKLFATIIIKFFILHQSVNCILELLKDVLQFRVSITQLILEVNTVLDSNN